MSLVLPCVVFAILSIFSCGAYADSQPGNHASFSIINNFVEINSTTKEGKVQSVQISKESLLFDVVGHLDQNGNLLSFSIQRKLGLQNMYKDLEIAKDSHGTVFIYPSFTQAAYEEGGFYDYYRKNCDSRCLTVPMPSNVNGSSLQHYWRRGPQTTQLFACKRPNVDKNPDILKQYKRMIVLHNEYVTKKNLM